VTVTTSAVETPFTAVAAAETAPTAVTATPLW
jgi:hypothetical protein